MWKWDGTKAVVKCLTRPPRGQSGADARARRGTGWHRGQKKDERFMKDTRRIAVPQRRHARPSCP